MPDDNVKNGKLLTVNAGDGNFPSDYEYRLREHTKTDRYYTYIEALIPTKIINNTSNPIRFFIGEIEVRISAAIYVEYRGYGNKSKQLSELDILDKEYLVLSIMVLPKLNDNPTMLVVDGGSVYINSIALFCNGNLLNFESTGTDGHSTSLFPTESLFYESEENVFLKLQDLGNQATTNGYIIWNTEYERFMYKDLADMCYSRTTRQLASDKEPLTPIIHDINGEGFTFSWNELDLYNKFTNASVGDIVYYIELEYDISNTSEASNLEFSMYYLGTYLDNQERPIREYNHLDNIFKNEYSTLNDYYWENDISLKDNAFLTGQLDGIYNYTALNVITNITNASTYSVAFEVKSNTGALGAPNISRNFVIDKEANEDKLYIAFYGIKDTDSTHLVVYAGSAIGTSDNYNIELESTHQIISLSFESIHNDSYSLIVKANDTNLNINTGYTRYHTYITDKEKSTLSLNNARWKTMMKYNRTITFTTYLQDNPVILPLELFTSNDDNMFVELKVERQNNSKLEWAFCTGIELYDRTDNDNVKNIAGGVWHCEGSNLNNADSIGYRSSTESFNGGGGANNFDYDSIILYYNKKKDSDNAYIVGLENNNIFEIRVMKSSSITDLNNIYLHLIPEDIENSAAGTELGTITINFGPVALNEKFQPYIDELLQQDVKPTIKYHNQNIFKNHNFHTTQELVAYFGYDSDTNGIAGYDKGVWY